MKQHDFDFDIIDHIQDGKDRPRAESEEFTDPEWRTMQNPYWHDVTFKVDLFNGAV